MIELKTPREIRAGMTSDNPFLIEGLIHRKITFIVGSPDVGKSMLAAALVEALATGAPTWLGRKIHADAPLRTVILYTDPGADEEYAIRVSTDDGWLAAPIGPGENWDECRDTLREAEADVVVLDNLTLLVDGDLNSAQDASRTVGRLNRLLRAGMTIVVLAHTAKPTPWGKSRTPLGSTAWAAWARHQLILEGNPSQAGRTLHVEGNNVRGGRYRTRLDVVDGRPVWDDLEQLTEQEKARQQRSATTLDRNRAAAEYLRQRPDLLEQSKTVQARALEDAFPSLNADSWRNQLKPGKPVARLLEEAA